MSGPILIFESSIVLGGTLCIVSIRLKSLGTWTTGQLEEGKK